jgi:hypothetical protein
MPYATDTTLVTSQNTNSFADGTAPYVCVLYAVCCVVCCAAAAAAAQVGGIVETSRPDNKNAQYAAIIKHGDVLLGRIQKLSKVVSM